MSRAFPRLAVAAAVALLAGGASAAPGQPLYVGHGFPSWSPGGRHLLYARFVAPRDPRNGECCLDGSSALWVTGPRGPRLLSGTEGAEAPSWSRDGKRLAFVRRGRVYVARADGTRARLLRRDTHAQYWPAWSPDGRRLSFWRARCGGRVRRPCHDQLDVYVVGADGRGLRRIAANVAGWGPAAWSPDARRLAFGRDTEIWVVNADGTGARRIAAGESLGEGFSEPAWSPDGRRLVVRGSRGLYVMSADGTGIRRITSASEEADSSPAWSPGGRRIAFAGMRNLSGEMRIYVVAPDGSALRRLTS
jgi:Tol biopolymer transport system component